MSKRIAGVTALLAVFILAGLEANYAHGDKEHDGNDEKEAVPDTLVIDESFEAEQDSIFVLINERYTAVEHILKKDCYNCHSIQTDFPWYHSIPGVAGFMDGHISEAQEHVDFSYGFPFGGHGDPLSTLLEIKDEIEDGNMPIFSYRIMHWGSLIEGDKQDTLFLWIDESVAMIRDLYERAGIQINSDDDDDEDDDNDDDD